jgi:hypothetical protein
MKKEHATAAGQGNRDAWVKGVRSAPARRGNEVADAAERLAAAGQSESRVAEARR